MEFDDYSTIDMEALFLELQETYTPVTLTENVDITNLSFWNSDDDHQFNDPTQTATTDDVELLPELPRHHSVPVQNGGNNITQIAPVTAEENLAERDDGTTDVELAVKINEGKWTEDEHKLFLLGLTMHGKGDWINIKDVVKTRTSRQVACHAQNYFKQVANQRRKRKRMHDITLQNSNPISLYHQIRISSPNLAMQQLHEVHHLVFDNINQQNWTPSLNAAMQQSCHLCNTQFLTTFTSKF